MFEIGARVQVFRKGVFFPARANKLYELYKQYNSIEEIDAKTLEQIQNKYFKRSIAEVWAETQAYYAKEAPDALAKAEQNPKQKMALIFRWYFINSTRLAMKGTVEGKVDFQVHTGPAMGAFNQWVKGSQFENWRNRNVDTLADLLMNGAVKLLKIRYLQMQGIISRLSF
jgi:trans-AT polyketide synthase/acyltransferase/oxidoreductase domain-containing protein